MAETYTVLLVWGDVILLLSVVRGCSLVVVKIMDSPHRHDMTDWDISLKPDTLMKCEIYNNMIM